METATKIHNSLANGGDVGVLRRLAQARIRADLEQCEFCSVPLEAGHRHLLEVAKRNIICVCTACGLRFENVVGGRWKLIPREVRSLDGFQLSDSEWDELALPISLAFFLYSTATQKMTVLYPSPAGATESLLPLSNWQRIVQNNPKLGRLELDVEALLVNRAGPTREYYIAPIDVCFELVGTIRLHWRGLSGGTEVWREIEAFFANLRRRGEEAHARA